MEEKKMTTDVAELQKKVEELTNQLKDQQYMAEAYKRAADEYREYWLKNVDKIKKMKEDMADIQKLANKLIERW